MYRLLPARPGIVTAVPAARQRIQQDAASAIASTVICRKKACIDCLQGAECSTIPGAFGFWPEAAKPAWAPTLPPDLDDTALATVELLAAGRLCPAGAKRNIYHILARDLYRPRLTDINRPWLRDGAYKTWISDDTSAPNVVDCCVNANAMACGADELYAAHSTLRPYRTGHQRDAADPVCSSAYSRTYWYSDALRALRGLPQRHMTTNRNIQECM